MFIATTYLTMDPLTAERNISRNVFPSAAAKTTCVTYIARGVLI